MALACDHPKAFLSNHWNIGSCQRQQFACSVLNRRKKKSSYRVRRKYSGIEIIKVNSGPRGTAVMICTINLR